MHQEDDGMPILKRKSFKVSTRLGFAFSASILAILIVGFIAWNGFNKSRLEISTFQAENIPQLKHSLNLSEIGMALEAFSLTIPSANDEEELIFYQENLKERIATIEKLIDLLVKIQEKILNREHNEQTQIIKTYILSLNGIKTKLQNNLNDLLVITRRMMELEEAKKLLFNDINQHSNHLREKFSKKIDALGTELQIYVQDFNAQNDTPTETKDAAPSNEGKITQTLKPLMNQVDELRINMDSLANTEKVAGFLLVASTSQVAETVEKTATLFNADLPSFTGKINRIGDSESDREIKEIIKVFVKAGIGKNSIFEVRRQQFKAQHDSEAVMEDTKTNISELRSKIKTIVELIGQEGQKSSDNTLRETRMAIHYIVWVIAVTILLVTIITYLLSRSIVKPLQRAVEVAHAIAEGELNNEIEVVSTDEMGQLLRAFSQMQTQLRQRIEADKQIADEALRINRALDSVTTSVLIADAAYNIIFLNKAAKELLKKEEKHFQQRLGEFDVNSLLNTSIDTYHIHPRRQRELLEQLTTSYASTFKMGELIIDSTVTPVINALGERLGMVAEFRDVTLQTTTQQEINAVIMAASQGDFEKRISLENKTDFFKVFSAGVNQILDFNQWVVKDLMRIFSALAKGDLTQTIENNYAGVLEQLKNDANLTIKQLTNIMTVIKKMADTVNSAAEQLSRSNSSLSQRTEEQATSLEQTASSMEEMTSIVQQSADNAKHANQLAISAKDLANQGSTVVKSAISAMAEISHSSNRITDIIGVIDEIAFQTNLLALNAAVEAARAGEQGRGFAVVANEVRNLAQRSATAAKEIKKLIQDSVHKVEEGTRLTYKSGETLEEIVTAVKKVSDIIAEIAAASQEQSMGINQVNQVVIQMDKVTQQNAEMVEQATTASAEMSTQAQILKDQVAFFQIALSDEPIQHNNNQKKITPRPPSKTATPYPHTKHSTQDTGWEDF